MKWTLAILFFFSLLLLFACDSVEPQTQPDVWVGYHGKDTITIDRESSAQPIMFVSSIKAPFISVFDNGEHMVGESGYDSFDFWYAVSGDVMQGRFILYRSNSTVDTHLILERQWH